MKPVPRDSSQIKGHRRTLSLEPLEQRLLLQADWTFMVYLDGDNNLEAAAIDDFLEMAHIGSTADVNIVVQFDRSTLDETTGGTGYSSDYSDWTDTRRGLVAQDDVPDAGWGASIGEANMGDPNVLEAFLTYAMTNYQADHYALILWDHGSGYTGVEFDETDGDNLTMSELSSGIQAGLSAAGVSRIDLVNFDGCLMSMAEVAHQLKDVADIMVTSEDLVPYDGLPYDRVLEDLVALPQMSPTELAELMANEYLKYYAFTGTYAVTDLRQMDGLSAALSDFADTFINDGTPEDRYQLSQYWMTVPWFADPNYLDIGVLMTDISDDTVMTQSIRDAADDVLTAYGDTIIANYAGSWSSGGSGLSIYLPDNWGVVDPDYNAGELDFAADTQWDEFLNWWTGAATASSWTFMVYMCGDNNLEMYALQDFLEMASVGSNDAVNIVVMLDRSAFYDTTFNDWTGARRGLVDFGDQPYDADDPGVPPAYFAWGADLGEVNMGDPDVLSDFIDWATTMYPAQNYALTFWDHGGGLDGVIYDDDDGAGWFDNLTVMEVDEALQAAGVNIDVLRFDACLMSMLEVAYQIRNDADYMVASEDYGWAVGGVGVLSPYDTVLRTLTMQPSMTAVELADLMAESYYSSWPVGSLSLMNSVVDLSKVDELADAVDDLAEEALDVGTVSDRVLMEQHRLNSPWYNSYQGWDGRDLGTFLAGVAGDEDITPSIAAAAADALDAYNDAIVANYTDPGAGTGLAIYMPGQTPAGTYNWQSYDFADATAWDEFLDWWAANELTPVAVFQSGSTTVSFYDCWGVLDIDPDNILVKLSGTVVKSIEFAGDDPMYGLGIVINGATSVGKIRDRRTAPGDIAFIASNTGIKQIQLVSDVAGEWLNGRSLGGMIFPSDIDGDGSLWDSTAFYVRGGVQKFKMMGSILGGALFRGPVKSFELMNGDLWDDVLILGDVGKMKFTGPGWGWIWDRLFVDGDVKSLDMPDGMIMSESIVDITGYLKKASIGIIDAGMVSIIDPLDNLADIPLMAFDPSTFNFSYSRGATLRTGDGIGKLTVDWFAPGAIFYDDTVGGSLVEPTTGTDQRYFVQYLMSNVLAPHIRKLDVLQGMAHARILAGADLGDDLLPGGTGANADSYGPGYIGSLRVGTQARRGRVGEVFLVGDTEGLSYGGGAISDSLVGAGLFRFMNWGGSGYNLVTLHDNYWFQDGSYIGKIDVVGRVVSRYNEIEAAGTDLSDATPPEYPYFVPFGIGSYMINQLKVQNVPASAVTTISGVGYFIRHPYIFVEIPRGLGANA